MKKIYLLLLIFISFKSYSQTFSLNELMNLAKNDFNYFDTYVSKKGFKFMEADEEILSDGRMYSLKQNNISKSANKFISFNNAFLHNSQRVGFQTLVKSDYLNIKSQLISNKFLYQNTEIINGESHLNYLKNNYDVTLISGQKENEFGVLVTHYLIHVTYKQKQPTIKKTDAKKPATKPVVNKEKKFEIETPFGKMTGVLFDSTPLHRDNFVKLANEGFYDSLLFHRVIQGFMIQGGDPQSKNADANARLGSGSAPGERIPAEFKPYLIHKRGALAAARDGNPEKASSNCQFYIVQGRKYTDEEIKNIENQVKFNNFNFNYTEKQKNIYKTEGGTPFLDQNYTVFGAITSGLDIMDKIAAVETKNKQIEDRPVENVWFKIKILN